MRITRPVLGKILQHSQGLGIASPETVRRRAQELALIDGREVYNDQDWKRAFFELHGGNHDSGDANGHGLDDEMQDVISERDMIAPSLGHHVGRAEVDGGDSIGEELIAEGLDEAAHDRMLQSRRDDSEQESRTEDTEDTEKK